MQKLAVGEFSWVEGLVLQDLLQWDAEGEYGFFAEVDAYIPPDLHDYFSDLPPMPDHIIITNDMLSPASRELKTKLYGPKHKLNARRLAPNLFRKEKYKLHVKTLQLYVKLGVKITAIHKVVKFRQSDWLSRYIGENTRRRQLATTDFGKNFWKLANNAFFGKTCEVIM